MTLLQDLRYAARWLAKSPGFTGLAVVTLGLGIGANTALFSVVDAVLLQTLPVKEPVQLVLFEWQAGLSFRTTGRRGSFVSGPPGTTGASVFRYDIFERLSQARAAAPESPLGDFFAFAPIYEVTAVAGDQAEVVHGQAVTGGYYAGLGVRPMLGRGIADEDDRPGAAPVVVLSHQFWQERFAGNPAVIGQSLKLNQSPFTVVGVTPPAFTGALQVDYRPAVTVPLVSEPLLLGERSGMPRADKPGIWYLNVMGRLKHGATLDQARESLNGVFRAAALEVMPPPKKENEPARLDPKEYPRLLARPGGRGLMEHRQIYSRAIYGLFAVVAVVLLIACANLANLLLARAALRRAEISARLALGAGRWRLVRQLLTECLLIAALGGAAGVLFALWGKSALVALTDRDTGLLPNGVEPSLNWHVLAFTLGVALLTGVVFGLAPAWRTTGVDLATALKQGRRTTSSGTRLGRGLVVVQVALSVLLLSGAGLFLRTLRNLERVNLGFNQDKLLLFTLQPEQGGYKDERLMQFYRRLLARLDALPGVRAATFGRIPLIADYVWNTTILLPGEAERTARDHTVNRQMVRENYFEALEIPRLRGRGFTAQDDERAPRVAVINQTFARRFFPKGEVLGKRVTDTEGKREVEIVGVVSDTKYDTQRNEIEPLLYTPWQQEGAAIGEMHFVLRTAVEPTALAATVRQAVRELDATLPVTEVGTQEARSQATLGRERLYARLLSFFGVLALSLAAVGLFGVLAYSVAQRTNEIGIRMALGARVDHVVRMIVLQGLRPTLLGLILGLIGALALGRTLASLVYGVSVSDPETLAAVSALLLVVAALAAFLPARRAARVDPIVALRTE